MVLLFVPACSSQAKAGIYFYISTCILQSVGKYIIILGIVIVAIGAVITFFPKLNFFGRLPGDIEIKRDNFTVYIPIVTSILLSAGLTLIFWLINLFSRK